MKRVILYLVRKRLGLKKFEMFRFVNQKSDAIYYFTNTNVMKVWRGTQEPSNVSLNWLIDDECKVTTEL